MDKASKLALGLPLILLLAACGGGGGGGSDSSSGGPEPGPAQPGSYTGRITAGQAGDSILLLSQNPDGTANFVSRGPGTYATGMIEFMGGDLIGVVEQYAGGRPLTEDSFRGELEGESFTTFFTGSSYRTTDGVREQQSTFAFERQNQVSAIGANVANITGNWTDVLTPSPLTNITINDDGSLSGGGGGSNCTFIGSVTVPNPQVNIYQVQYNASNCQETSSTTFTPEEQQGNFQGYGFFKPASASEPRQFIVLADNDKISRYYVFQ